MSMRMRELSERSGLPKTTIHHYLREGLLPPAHKTAPNAAEYDESHLEGLRLITRLRDAEGGALSIPQIRRVLEHVDMGTSVRSAIRLVEADVDAAALPPGAWSGDEEFASSAGAPVEFIEELAAAGLIGTADGGAYAPADLLVARMCRGLKKDHDIDPADLAPISDLIREVGNYSSTLMDVYAGTAGSRDDSAVDRRELRGELAECCRAMLWRALER